MRFIEMLFLMQKLSSLTHTPILVLYFLRQQLLDKFFKFHNSFFK